MKHSLRNDTGLNATKADPKMGIPSKGPRQAPQERLLAGKKVTFKNAEGSDLSQPNSYNFKA